MVAARREWRGRVAPGIDPARVVFVGETGAKTRMAAAREYAPRGGRLVEAVPFGGWKTTTFVGAPTARGFVAHLVIDGAVTGSPFVA